ncbi:KUP/HAK/KT family potassium transporter [Listeria cornellensis]|uniref:Potassium transporter n=1 Tax=Listeria cornellensis FSL F6-0969 TaxID=1265820 RepID=W7BDH1_9LIST|nr:KUP/HAK/KT family potassium transporter [Listeria cornellensis]EUJ25194.1 potassium transporter [Listeria cornellensis FSL F6-0969]
MERKDKIRLGLAIGTLGIVYGDIGTSPLYVMKSIVASNGGLNNVSEDYIIGSLSLIFLDADIAYDNQIRRHCITSR